VANSRLFCSATDNFVTLGKEREGTVSYSRVAAEDGWDHIIETRSEQPRMLSNCKWRRLAGDVWPSCPQSQSKELASKPMDEPIPGQPLTFAPHIAGVVHSTNNHVDLGWELNVKAVQCERAFQYGVGADGHLFQNPGREAIISPSQGDRLPNIDP
jgi:hypothetical protein